jgi:hypothetical protein
MLVHCVGETAELSEGDNRRKRGGSGALACG